MDIFQEELDVSSPLVIYLFNLPLKDCNALNVKYPSKVHMFDTWSQLVLSSGEVGKICRRLGNFGDM